jgi:hypothetical protein
MDLKDFGRQLSTLWQNKQLGHFYIFISPVWPQDIVTAPPFDFISKVLAQDPAQLKAHPDVFIAAPRAKGNYTVEDLEAQGLFSFFALKSFQGGARFVVIPHAEQLSEVILNKLLKTLENPPPHTTIFFLAAQEKFPATIISRANVWRAASDPAAFASSALALGADLSQALRGFFQGTTSWSVLQEALKAEPQAEASLLAWMADILATYPAPHYQITQQLQADWQLALTAQKWHRPLAPLFYVLLTQIRTHLPAAAQSLA